MVFPEVYAVAADAARKKMDTITQKGFYTARDISFSLGLSTAIFGKFENFGPNSPITAIRARNTAYLLDQL